MNSRFELMKKIQELHFTLIDSGLYLNAYDCDEAHEYGKMIHQKYKFVNTGISEKRRKTYI